MLRKALTFLALTSSALAQYTWTGPTGNTTTVGTSYTIVAQENNPDGTSPLVTLLKNGNFAASGNYAAAYNSTETTASTINFSASGYASGHVAVNGTYSITVNKGSMTPPTSQNYTILSVGTWAPAVTCPSGNGSGSGAYCIQSYTGWNTVSQSIATIPTGNYSLYVAQVVDANHTGNAQDPATGIWYELNGTPYTLTVNPTPQPAPTITASPSQGTVYAGQTVTFTGSGSGNSSWTWGGAASGSSISTTVTFNTPGTYTVSLYKPGDNLYSQSPTTNMTISVIPAVTVSASPATAIPNQSITFATANGAGTGGWVWGGDGAGLSGASPTKSFPSTGTYNVTVYKQSDSATAQSNTATVSVSVINAYTLTINGGTGSGSYGAGTAVQITANAINGRTFAYWTAPQGTPGTIDNAYASPATFTMGAGNATLTPAYYDVPPTAPGSPSVSNISATAGLMSWTASSDTDGIAGYVIQIDGAQVSMPLITGTSFQLPARTFAPNTTHTVAVAAVDGLNVQGPWSSGTTFTTTADTTAPLVPNPRASAVSVTTFNLIWDVPWDEVGVTQYRVYQTVNGTTTLIGTTTSPNYQMTGLTMDTSYTYSVAAGDAAGNWSAQSTPVTITTNSPVTVGLHAAGYGLTSSQSLTLSSYEGAYSTTSGVDPQTTTATGAGSSSWTAVHQYRGFAPGVDNALTLAGGSPREVRFEVPAGYTLFVAVNGTEVPYTNTATIDMTNITGTLNFSLMPNDGTTALDAGYSIDPEISIKNVVWAMSLGRTADGLTLGSLSLRKTDIVGDPIAKDTLKITGQEQPGLLILHPDSEFGCWWGSSRRIISTPYCIVFLDDQTVTPPSGAVNYFEVKVYDPATTVAWNGSAYTFTKNGTAIAPFARYGFSNASGSSNNTINITKNVGQAQQLGWTLNKAPNGSTTTWTLQRAGNRTLKLVSTVSGSGVGATTTDVVTLTDGSGNVAQTFQKVYQKMPWNSWELLTEQDDPSGFNLTTTYTYGQTAGQGSYGKLTSVTKPDGTYTAYDYYNDDANFGNLAHTYSRWLDVASTASTATSTNAQTVTLTYSPVHGFMCDALNTTTTTVPSGGVATTIAKSARNPDFTSTTFNGHKVRKETIQAYYNSTSYLTTTRLSYHPDETATDQENQLISETSPTGTKVSTIYYKGTFTDSGDSNSTVFRANGANTQWGEYKFNGFSTAVSGSQLVSTWDSQPIDPIYLVPNRSTIELTVMDKGNPAYKVNYVFTGASGGVPTFEFLSEEKYLISTTTDSSGITTTTKTDSLHNGSQTVQTFTNGRLMSETANDGEVTTYSYDTTGLLSGKGIVGCSATGNYAAQGGLYTYYTYDAASRKTAETVSTSTTYSTTGITTSYSYDSGGRLSQQTDPTGLVTTITYDLTNHATTSTLPGGATKIVTTYADGTPKSITGTAVVNSFAGVVVNADGTITKTAYTLRSSDVSNPTAAPRWAKTTTDWLGRTTRSETPAIGGTVAQVYNYNAKGELSYVQTVDGTSGTRLLADTYTDYNAYEMPYRTGQDLDSTADLQITSSLDRITETDAYYQKDASNVWWLVKTSAVYNQAGSGTAVTTTTTKYRQNAFAALGTNIQTDSVTIDLFGNQTETKTTVDRANLLVTVTSTVPTSSVPTTSVTRNGLAVSQTSSSNLTTTFAYDAYRRLICTSDPRIDGSAFAKDLPARTGYYDQTAAVGARWQKAWDKDTAGFQTTYSYSSTTGRLSAVQAPPIANQTGKFTYFDYSRRGETVRTWGGKTYPVEYAFNDYGEQVAMRTFRGSTDFTGATWPLADDTDPLTPVASSWTSGDKTTWTFDTATGVLLSKTDATNKSISYTYTQLGQVKVKTLARGDTLTYKYYREDAGDPLTGELKSVDFSNTTSTNPDISYTYNRLGKLATVTDAVGTHTYAYDSALLTLTSETLPATFSNGSNARLLTQSYDTTGTGTKGRDIGFSLGIAGNTTGDYSVTYGYDTYGRGGSVTSAGATFTYGYTAGSSLVNTITDGSSYAVTKTWNANRNLLASIDTKMGTTSKATFQYGVDEWGRRTSLIRSGEMYSAYINSGLVTTWGYDDRSQVTSAQTYYGTSLSDLSYPVEGRNFGFSYDNIGNRLTSSVDGRTTNYNSNALNQITDRVTPGTVDVAGIAPTGSTVSVTAQGNAQTVDRQGNYYHSAASVANTSSSVNANISVTSTNPASTISRKVFLAKNALLAAEQWQYDADGNLLRDDQWTYTWTDENRLASIETRADLVSASVIATTDAKHIDFTYDYLGRRAEKIVRGGWNGSTFATILSDTRFIYHGWNLVAELAFNSQLSTFNLGRAYTWGLDLSGTLAGDGGTGGLLMTQDGATQYVYAYDGNGNVSAVMNRSTGTTVAEYEYGSFGEVLRGSDTYAQTNPFRFSTQYVDNETGYSYYGHRYYNPQTGRFLCRDRTEERGGLNLYAFCENNGANRWDLLGNGGTDANGIPLSGPARDAYEANQAAKFGRSAMQPGTYYIGFGQMSDQADRATGNLTITAGADTLGWADDARASSAGNAAMDQQAAAKTPAASSPSPKPATDSNVTGTATASTNSSPNSPPANSDNSAASNTTSAANGGLTFTSTSGVTLSGAGSLLVDQAGQTPSVASPAAPSSGDGFQPRSPSLPDYWTVGTVGFVTGLVTPLTSTQNTNSFISWVGLQDTPLLQASRATGQMFSVIGAAYAGAAAAPEPAPAPAGGKILVLDPAKYPIPLNTLDQAGALYQPLPVNRAAAPANRAAALSGIPTVPGFDLDEAPPAMFRNPGDPVVVQPTPPAQNRGAGASLGNQARPVPDGGTVIIVPGETWPPPTR